MVFQPFTIAEKRPIRPGMTISRPLHLGQSTGAAWFSLSAGTSISPERYDRPALYVGLRARVRCFSAKNTAAFRFLPTC